MRIFDRLPDKFLYSQQSLSAFEQCPMRFKKRYLENLRWENVFDIEQKRAVERGRDFHLLARRYFLGMDNITESSEMQDEILQLWLHNLKHTFKLQPEATYLPEYTITMRSGKLRLQATLDLIIVKEGEIEIWDWKTHNPFTSTNMKKAEKRLEKSLQTKVYLFMLKEYSSRLTCIYKTGGMDTERDLERDVPVCMHYWQPEAPGITIDIEYDDKAHEENRAFLMNRISDMEAYDWKSFDKMPYSRQCRYCEFNWLCNGPAADPAGISNGGDDTESEGN